MNRANPNALLRSQPARAGHGGTGAVPTNSDGVYGVLRRAQKKEAGLSSGLHVLNSACYRGP